MRYAIVVEKAGKNFSGFAPDLPGCVATGAAIDETETELLSAIQFHLDGLREGCIAPPPAEILVEYIFVLAQRIRLDRARNEPRSEPAVGRGRAEMERVP